MNRDLNGKKLLVIGGASQHVKVVETARNLGIETFVTDYLPSAPAKDIAGHSYQINITDTEEIIRLCEKERIDGCISGWLDACQIPYVNICEKMGFYCYGTSEQFKVLTNKKLFKEKCREYGVGTPKEIDWREYAESEGKVKCLPFPVIVKPSNSRGSKGTSVCNTVCEFRNAVKMAKENSIDGTVVAEQYIDKAEAFLVVYFYYGGKHCIQQLSDAVFADPAYGLDKVASAYVTPSAQKMAIRRLGDFNLIRMFSGMGIKEGPVCLQGFVSEGEVLYFDPGRRFPGGEYERVVKDVTGIDFVEAAIRFSLTGEWGIRGGLDDIYMLGGQHAIRIQVNVRSGIVAKEHGFDVVEKMPGVSYVAKYHNINDEIEESHDVRQRYAQIVLHAVNKKELVEKTEKIMRLLSVRDKNDIEMIVPAASLNAYLGGYLSM